MKQARWCKAYVGLVREPRLSVGARLLLVVLRSYCPANRDSCFPSNETLAADLGCNRRSLSRYLLELEKLHWIRRKRRRRRDRAFTSTFYELLDERKSLMKEAIPTPGAMGQKRPMATVEEIASDKYCLSKRLRRKIVPFAV